MWYNSFKRRQIIKIHIVQGVRITLLIRKRYVYLDAPFKIESKDEPKTQIDTTFDEKQKELLEIISKANKEAENLISQAQEKANIIILQAQEEYNEILKQAQEQAQDIIKQAIAETELEKKIFFERLKKLIESFDSGIQEVLNDYAERLNNISKLLVEKFLEKEIDPEVTKRKLLKVLTHVIGAAKVKIRINPEDLKLLDYEILNELKSRNYEFVPDSSISYGVIAETDLGTIDTTLKFQFVLLDEIFEEVFKNESI